jgi:hypothetical protein
MQLQYGKTRFNLLYDEETNAEHIVLIVEFAFYHFLKINPPFNYIANLEKLHINNIPDYLKEIQMESNEIVETYQF